MKKITIILLVFFVVGQFAVANDPKDDIMLQSFGWDEGEQPKVKAAGNLYKFILSKASEWKSVGFDMIWMPPPSRSSGGVGYLPTELYNFNSGHGSEVELRAATAALKANGLHPIADVVANHRSGTNDWTTFTNPSWSCSTISSTDEANTNWTASRGPKPCGTYDTGEDFDGGRDLDHTNIETRDGIKTYLTKLKEQGFEGWRWDMTKGFSASYVGEYNTSSTPYFSVGEFWDGDATKLKNWVDGTGKKSTTFDFSQYYSMQEGLNGNYAKFGSGNTMAGLVGVYGYSDYAVTFVDNHDTFVKFGAPEGNNIMKGYAYILTHPGIPCVFIAHYYGGSYKKDNQTRIYSSYKEQIDPIMAVRKANQIDAWSSIQVATTSGVYAAYIKKRYEDVSASVAVKIGTGSWSPEGSGWILSSSGTNYAVWSKVQIVVPPTLSSSPGTYQLGQKLTMSALADYSIRFTTDGSEPTTSSTLYIGEITLPEGTTTYKVASFLNNVKSAVVTNSYTAIPKASSIIVRFKAPNSWTACKIYVWEGQGAATALAGVWPGTVIQKDTDGFYAYTISNHTSFSVGIVFNNATGANATEQTIDLSANSSICWQAIGSHKYAAEVVNCPVTSIDTHFDNQISIYPNPISDVLNINTTEQLRRIRLFDNLGRIYQLNARNDNAFDISSIKAGMYYLQIETVTARKETHKILKN